MKKRIALLFASIVASCTPPLAHADCPQFYPGQAAIQPLNAIELCNSFFVTQYDDVNKRNFFSSELLQPDGHVLKRKDSFHADKRSTNAVKPQEYYDSGVDKGHMVPSDDSTTYVEMNDTFLMTNMTPQDSKLNRGPWKNLEEHTRKAVADVGKPSIVVTGAIYGDNKKMGRVPAPTGYYKIVYIPGVKPYALYADNTDASKPSTVQISWINAQTSMKFPQE